MTAFDGYLPRSKKLLVSALAKAAYFASVAWCSVELTDGRISRAEMIAAEPLLAMQGADANAIADAVGAELVRSGAYERLGDGIYDVVDYLADNPTRAEVLAKRERENERYAARKARRKPRTRGGQSQRGATEPLSQNVRPLGQDFRPSGLEKVSAAETRQTVSPPPVPPLVEGSDLQRRSKSDRDYLSDTQAVAEVQEVVSDLGSISPEEEGERRTPSVSRPGAAIVTRWDYQPSDQLWARWQHRVDTGEWQDALVRYRTKGTAGLKLEREHEWNFGQFLKSTERYRKMREASKAKRAQARASAAAEYKTKERPVATSERVVREPVVPIESAAPEPEPIAATQPKPKQRSLSYFEAGLAGLGRVERYKDDPTYQRVLKEALAKYPLPKKEAACTT